MPKGPYLRLLTLLFSVLAFAPGGATSESVLLENCVHSHGYWKTHSDAWPRQSLVLGNAAFGPHTYQRNELLSLLGASPKGDASLIVAMQLIAAKLNIASGANAQPIAEWIEHADQVLGRFRQRLPYGVKTNTPLGTDLALTASVLEKFNTGYLAGSCQAANAAPIANAGVDRSVAIGSTVTLDGSASSDADGQALTFRWTLISRPANSAAVLADSTAVRPTFVADAAGNYDVRLIVNDGVGSSRVDLQACKLEYSIVSPK